MKRETNGFAFQGRAKTRDLRERDGEEMRRDCSTSDGETVRETLYTRPEARSRCPFSLRLYQGQAYL